MPLRRGLKEKLVNDKVRIPPEFLLTMTMENKVISHISSNKSIGGSIHARS
jgi:hypothetical protein